MKRSVRTPWPSHADTRSVPREAAALRCLHTHAALASGNPRESFTPVQRQVLSRPLLAAPLQPRALHTSASSHSLIGNFIRSRQGKGQDNLVEAIARAADKQEVETVYRQVKYALELTPTLGAGGSNDATDSVDGSKGSSTRDGTPQGTPLLASLPASSWTKVYYLLVRRIIQANKAGAGARIYPDAVSTSLLPSLEKNLTDLCKLGYKPNPYDESAAVRLLHRDPAIALQWIERARELGSEPDLRLWNKLLSVFRSAGDCDGAVALAERLSARGELNSEGRDIVLALLVESGQIDAALTLRGDSPPDVASDAILLEALVTAGQLQTAAKVAADIEPHAASDAAVAAALLRLRCAADGLMPAVDFVVTLREQGGVPTPAMITTLVLCAVRVAPPEDAASAISLLSDLQALTGVDVEPSAVEPLIMKLLKWEKAPTEVDTPVDESASPDESAPAEAGASTKAGASTDASGAQKNESSGNLNGVDSTDSVANEKPTRSTKPKRKPKKQPAEASQAPGPGTPASAPSTPSDKPSSSVPSSVTEALLVYNYARDLGTKPSQGMVYPIIDTLCSMPLTDHAWGLIRPLYEDFFREAPRGAGPDAELYRLLLNASFKPSFSLKLFETFVHDALERRVRFPPMVAFNFVRRAVSQCGEDHEAAWGLYLDLHKIAKGSFNGEQFGMILQDFLHLPGRLPASILFDYMLTMHRAKCPPDVYIYTMVLSHLCSRERADFAIVDRLHALIKLDHYITPNTPLLTSLMNAYSYAGAPARALRIFETLCNNTRAGTEPSVGPASVSVIFDCLGFSGDTAVADRAGTRWAAAKIAFVRAELDDIGYTLNEKNSDAYVEALCRTGQTHQAIKFAFHDHHSLSNYPSPATLEIMQTLTRRPSNKKMMDELERELAAWMKR